MAVYKVTFCTKNQKSRHCNWLKGHNSTCRNHEHIQWNCQTLGLTTIDEHSPQEVNDTVNSHLKFPNYRSSSFNIIFLWSQVNNLSITLFPYKIFLSSMFKSTAPTLNGGQFRLVTKFLKTVSITKGLCDGDNGTDANILHPKTMDWRTNGSQHSGPLTKMDCVWQLTVTAHCTQYGSCLEKDSTLRAYCV